MRHVNFAPLAHSVSAIGFGCASLGSRVDGKRGTAALERAYEAGVSWFDVAPSYGDGQAEKILGEFLVGKRARIVLCTKVGKAPGRTGLVARMLKPAAQRVLKVAPQLRGLAASGHAQSLQAALTGSLIKSSIADSMKQLRTDYLDVLALHDTRLADMQRDDVLRALEDAVSGGQARCISMAGDVEVALRAVSLSARIRVIQVANNFFSPNIERAKRELGNMVGYVGHSVFGHTGPLEKFTKSVKKPDKRRLLEVEGYRGSAGEMAAAYLLDFALASNREGVVLLSMYDERHLRSNLGRLAAAPAPDVVLGLQDQLGLE